MYLTDPCIETIISSIADIIMAVDNRLSKQSISSPLVLWYGNGREKPMIRYEVV